MQNYIFRNDLWDPSIELLDGDDQHVVQLIILGEHDRIFSISEVQEELCHLCQCKGKTGTEATQITLYWTSILQEALFYLLQSKT